MMRDVRVRVNTREENCQSNTCLHFGYHSVFNNLIIHALQFHIVLFISLPQSDLLHNANILMEQQGGRIMANDMQQAVGCYPLLWAFPLLSVWQHWSLFGNTESDTSVSEFHMCWLALPPPSSCSARICCSLVLPYPLWIFSHFCRSNYSQKTCLNCESGKLSAVMPFITFWCS